MKLICFTLITWILLCSFTSGVAQGTLDPGFATGTGAEDAVQALALQPDGKIIAAGLFFNINGTANSRGIARLNSNGSVDGTFNPGTSVDYGISSVAVQPDGKILLAGGFTLYQGVSRRGIARINDNGTLDATFNPGNGVNQIINGIARQSDGKILITGAFTTYDGVARNGVARLNMDGTLDTTFNPGTGLDFAGQSVVVQTNGSILVAGGFLNYNGVQRRGVVRILANGDRDETFNPGVGVNNQVLAVRLQPDGKVLIGGDFTAYASVGRNRIARLNSDATLDTSFNPGFGANATVRSIEIQPNGKILVAGAFTFFNGTTRNRVARLLPNGALDTAFNPGTGANNLAQCLAVQPDGKVVLGGTFTLFNATASARLARLLINDPIQTPFLSLANVADGAATLSWNSVSNGVYRVDCQDNWNGAWSTLAAVTATNNPVSTVDTNAPTAGRLYRVAFLPW